jgi:hypothetical protein
MTCKTYSHVHPSKDSQFFLDFKTLMREKNSAHNCFAEIGNKFTFGAV